MRERFGRRAAEAASRTEQEATGPSSVVGAAELQALSGQLLGLSSRLDRMETMINSFDMRLNPGISVLQGRIDSLAQQSTVIGVISLLLIIGVFIAILVVR